MFIICVDDMHLVCNEKELAFCIFIVLERAVSFNVFRGKISKDGRMKRNETVAVLEHSFRGHLQDSVRAPRILCLAQESLNHKASRHGHFHCVSPLVFLDLKAN